jgi:hypothetical protein
MKKSLKKQAVFPVLMLLVVTALALVGSSFAWFSVANQASVSTITGTAENGGVGLMISDKYNGTFSGSITMTTAADHFILPKYLKQLSSKDAANFFAGEIVEKDSEGKVTKIKSKAFSNYYNGTAEGQTTNTDGTVDGTVGYIDFTVYLQVEQEAYLFLDAGTTLVLANNGGSGTAQAGAYRIAVGTPVAVSGAAAKSTVFTIYGDQAENASGTGAWYPIAAASDTTAFNSYSEVATYSPEGKAAAAFSSIVAPAAMTATEMNQSAATAAHTLGTLAVGVNAVTFRIWLEGNDPQCTVEVALDQIALTLQFFACKKVA